MSNNKTARRDYIDIMKGLGILLVVLGHFMEQFRFGFKPIGATFICIYLFHMALFCICSGLVAHFCGPAMWIGRSHWCACLLTTRFMRSVCCSARRSTGWMTWPRPAL